MATYYKYAERSAESQVNWAEIGKNMTDMLRQEVQVRDQKKAALDEATRKAAQQISDAPQGEHVGAKTEAIRLADQATKYLLMQNRLMKQGILDPKDYMISHQNLSDGIKTAYSSMKAFQENYGKLMERAQKDESSMIELKRLEKIQGYGNFRQSGFFIDAPTGNLNVGLKEEQIIDGQKVIGLKPGSTVGMQYIDGAIYGQIDKYKYQEPLKVMADRIGEVVRTTVTPGTLNQIGYTKSLNDARQRINEMQIGSDDKKILYDFYQSAYDTIGTMLTNENHKASLLVDAMASKGYFWTDDPEEAAKNPKAVLEVIDPNTGRAVMKFNKEQDQAATDFMMQQFLGMIDVKEDIDSTGFVPPPREPSEASRRGKENESVISNIAKFYNGDDVAVKEAADFVRSLNPNIDTVDRTGDNIEITFKDGRAPEIIQWKAEDGSLIPIESWITANTNFFLPEGKRIADVNKIVARAGIDKNRTFNPESKAFSAGQKFEPKESVEDAFKRVILEESELSPDLFVADDDATTKDNLVSIISTTTGLSDLNIETGASGFFGIGGEGDKIILTEGSGDKKKEVARFDLDDMTTQQAESYVKKLIDLAAERTPIDRKAAKIQGKITPPKPIERTPKRGGITGPSVKTEASGAGSKYN
jgi:ADP-ribose pyrophosphatase YjhB (NUDIX family)